jgi:hypothetical protein
VNTREAPAAELATKINAEHQAALGKAREAIEHARRAGELLLQVKADVGHGGFLAWVAENVHCSARQAQRYMTLAENWSEIQLKYDTASHLTLTGALRLIDRRGGATEVERAQILERRFEDLRTEIFLLDRAADSILADPNADINVVATIALRAGSLGCLAVEIQSHARREVGRLLIELKRFTGLSDSELLPMLNDGSFLKACDERIAELAAAA